MSEYEPPDLHGKVVVVTGANSGIGKHAAISLAGAGARVVLACRNLGRGQKALEEVRLMSFNDQTDLMPLDLASFASIAAFAGEFVRRYERLDVLINNAGVMLQSRRLTADGLEATFGINHVGHFLLTKLLSARLVESAPSRVVTVTSQGHRFVRGLDFDDLQSEKGRFTMRVAYGRSKLANILFSHEFARRFADKNVTSNSLHPGVVATELGQDGDMGTAFRMSARLGRFVLTSAKRGATTSVYLASAPDVAEVTGGYFVDMKRRTPSRAARDEAAARRLWQVTEELVAPAMDG